MTCAKQEEPVTGLYYYARHCNNGECAKKTFELFAVASRNPELPRYNTNYDRDGIAADMAP